MASNFSAHTLTNIALSKKVNPARLWKWSYFKILYVGMCLTTGKPIGGECCGPYPSRSDPVPLSVRLYVMLRL